MRSRGWERWGRGATDRQQERRAVFKSSTPNVTERRVKRQSPDHHEDRDGGRGSGGFRGDVFFLTSGWIEMENIQPALTLMNGAVYIHYYITTAAGSLTLKPGLYLAFSGSLTTSFDKTDVTAPVVGVGCNSLTARAVTCWQEEQQGRVCNRVCFSSHP